MIETFPTKIVLATDGSDDSVRAAELAVELSRKTGSELHVVHVGMEYFLFAHDYISPSQYEQLKQERQKVIDDQVKSIEKAGGEAAGTHLRMGRRVDEEVVNLAEELDAGLIIVGSRGQGRMARSLLGSASDSIVRHAHCPVLVVREEKEGVEA